MGSRKEQHTYVPEPTSPCASSYQLQHGCKPRHRSTTIARATCQQAQTPHHTACTLLSMEDLDPGDNFLFESGLEISVVPQMSKDRECQASTTYDILTATSHPLLLMARGVGASPCFGRSM
ncbi:hypothetical protein Pmani_012311 [Petrolisthes manimaculis]|uniref:Uncharacterized protein n=1 Tax=Petrolisthes manimaculis TaxID=1843537 RepID=A0AAE1UDC4_9EUCA|nr:hypothetical protein Pmani_012311 [Petrolisthes manimaculis]